MLFTIEEFNRDINSSGDLVSRYSDWAYYREEVSEWETHL